MLRTHSWRNGHSVNCTVNGANSALFFFSLALPAHSGPWPLIQFHNNFFTDGITPWMSGQLDARPLPKHRTTQTQNKRIYTSNIHALSGIETHDPSI
jgi:hypothetical protein